jgi:hypothetical protein
MTFKSQFISKTSFKAFKRTFIFYKKCNFSSEKSANLTIYYHNINKQSFI